MTPQTDFSRFSLPRVNPFPGTLRVLEMEGARALSPDGNRWDIQVAAERPTNLWGGLSRGDAHTDFFIFGVWSAAAGLRRVPVSPLFDIGTMLEESGRVLDLRKREAANLPFPPLPVWELWLLDQAARPGRGSRSTRRPGRACGAATVETGSWPFSGGEQLAAGGRSYTNRAGPLALRAGQRSLSPRPQTPPREPGFGRETRHPGGECASGQPQPRPQRRLHPGFFPYNLRSAPI